MILSVYSRTGCVLSKYSWETPVKTLIPTKMNTNKLDQRPSTAVSRDTVLIDKVFVLHS